MPDYQIWECQICGWLYNEADGWPEDGIAPGTRWQDIPDDWVCPECGAAKADFEMRPLDPADTISQTASQLQPPVAILGTGLAGYHLAQELRKRDPNRPLLIISQDDGSYYYKPHLSTGFHHNRSAADLARTSAADMAEQLNAEILTFTRVLAVNTEQKSLSLEHKGNTYRRQFDSLVFATGAEAIRPPLAGDAAGEMVCINDLQDYAHLRALTRSRRRILIMGAGLIGAEYCNDLVQSGFQISVVDLLDRPLAQLAPPVIGAQLQTSLSNAGATFYFGQKVEQLQRHGNELSAQLTDGQQIRCDLVIAAVGVRPRTALAAEAGIAVHRGIVTDAWLRCSAPDIYALGDCAETDGQVRLYVAPLLATAKALAATLTGEPTPVQFGIMPIVVKTTLMPVCVCAPAPDTPGQWLTARSDQHGAISHFLDERGQLRGIALCGDGTRSLSSRIKQIIQ